MRRNIQRLSPPTSQHVEPQDGIGQPIRLLLIGDSSAAGVGVDDINNSLGGHLVKYLAQRSQRPVNIRIAGCNSATSGEIRDYVLPNIEFTDFTHILLNIGTNDAKNFHTARRFDREFGTLLYAINTRFPAANLIWSGIFDMSKISGLPSPLNFILGIRSREFMRLGKILCHERLAQVPQGNWQPAKENFSVDGFHASNKGYHEWAALVGAHILLDE